VQLNSFKVSENGVHIGMGCYPAISFISHSCDPNCVHSFRGCQIKLKCIKDVAVGEELSISYIDADVSVEERQIKLKSVFGFTCTCVKCVEEQRLHDVIKQLQRQSTPFCSIFTSW